MTKRGLARVAAGVRLLTLLRHRARARQRALGQIWAGVSGNADLREEQRHRGQRADPAEPNSSCPERKHGDFEDTRV